MNNTTKLDIAALPSTVHLLKATGFAIVAAAAILITIVLPAEYGVDPTGIGARLGLASLSMDKPGPIDVKAAPTSAAQKSAPVMEFDAAWRSAAPYRNDAMTVTLKPGEGTEVKASMRRGERLVFSWTTEGGKVNFDMHGEELNASTDEFTSYWQGRDQASGHGAFVAPFDGTHGWYWRNRNNQPVTIKVQTAGFYEKLFQK
jgi:hypothetical protein